MAHKRRNGKLHWRSKRANHGRMGGRGKEKGQFNREYKHKHRKRLRVA